MIVEHDGCIVYVDEAGTSERVPYAVPTDVFCDQITTSDATLSGEPIVCDGDWWKIVASFYETPSTTGWIEDLEDGYVVRQPLHYVIERIDDGNYVARFDEADIAMSGWDQQDAYQALIAEILDTFDTLSAEPRLSSHAAHQYEILSTYIAKA